MSEIAKILGQRIRNYRTARGLSQEKLAELSGCHHTYIGQLERGEKNATIESIEKISEALKVSLSTLFEKLGFTEEKNFGYTEDEELVVYSMRAFLSSPIQISCTLETVSEFELSMYCNEEIIAINQDTEYSAAKPVIMLEDGKKIVHVFKKKLSGGDTAYAVFNLGESEEKVSIYLDGEGNIRDAWAKKDLPRASKITVDTKPHTVKIYRVAN